MPFIGKIIYGVFSSKSQVEELQQHIRDVEWNAIRDTIPHGAQFLDVGCGAGYAMQRAIREKNCSAVGIDPEPGTHGVGRFEQERIHIPLEIMEGASETLPFESASFDVVYSSHVLEHVSDEIQTLREMKRVLKPGGVLIIGMPTATMALLNWLSQLIFTTHIKIYENFRFCYKPGRIKRLISVFKINSHSFPRARSIYYDFKHYRVSNWKKTIETEFIIESTHLPLWYSYPDYPRLFKPKKRKYFSSSVFFICKKRI